MDFKELDIAKMFTDIGEQDAGDLTKKDAPYYSDGEPVVFDGLEVCGSFFNQRAELHGAGNEYFQAEKECDKCGKVLTVHELLPTFFRINGSGVGAVEESYACRDCVINRFGLAGLYLEWLAKVLAFNIDHPAHREFLNDRDLIGESGQSFWQSVSRYYLDLLGVGEN